MLRSSMFLLRFLDHEQKCQPCMNMWVRCLVFFSIALKWVSRAEEISDLERERRAGRDGMMKSEKHNYPFVFCWVFLVCLCVLDGWCAVFHFAACISAALETINPILVISLSIAAQTKLDIM